MEGGCTTWEHHVVIPFSAEADSFSLSLSSYFCILLVDFFFLPSLILWCLRLRVNSLPFPRSKEEQWNCRKNCVSVNEKKRRERSNCLIEFEYHGEIRRIDKIKCIIYFPARLVPYYFVKKYFASLVHLNMIIIGSHRTRNFVTRISLNKHFLAKIYCASRLRGGFLRPTYFWNTGIPWTFGESTREVLLIKEHVAV